MISRLVVVLSALILQTASLLGGLKTEKVVLVTVDGVRWQEIFQGPDFQLFDPEKHGALMEKFQATTANERRTALLPFFWEEFVPGGILLGNGQLGSLVKLKNPYRFSYPGYAEILLGRVLPEIDSNDKIHSPVPTVLEFVKKRFNLKPREVAAFASWDVFEFICESQPGTIFVNAGFKQVPADLVTPSMEQLNRLQIEALTPWDSVRHDVFTGDLALEYLRAYRPKVLYVALGETDDWAHHDRYDRYLQTASFFDTWLKRLWETLESLEGYRGKTTVIVAVDHGRGSNPKDWPDHGEKVPVADRVWLAVRGPDTPSIGEARNTATVYASSIASTLLALLGVDHSEFSAEAGEPIDAVLTGAGAPR